MSSMRRQTDSPRHESEQDSLGSPPRRGKASASIQHRSKSSGDRVCARLVFARPGSTLMAQAAFVLKHVVPKLVGKDVAQHESTQAVTRPRNDTFLAQIRACGRKLCALRRRQRKPQPPGRRGLIVEKDSARSDQHPESEALDGSRGWDQFYRLDAVVDPLAKSHESATNIGRRCRMVLPGSRTARTHHRKSRPSRGSDTTRITAETARHRPMMTLRSGL